MSQLRPAMTGALAMSAEPAQKFEALEAQAQRLMGTFTRAGYEQVAPAMIQPAGMFLDVVGEELSARTYVFTDPDGEELCLRPDLTVPTCRLHLARHPAGNVPARYCYNGPAFRYQPGGDTSVHRREFRQAGIESFAAPDREQDDAAVRARHLGAARGWLERLQAQYRRSRPLHGAARRAPHAAAMAATAATPLLAAGSLPCRADASVLRRGAEGERPAARADRALDRHQSAERSGARRDTPGAAGIELIGTRTLGEIAERLVAEAADAREARSAPSRPP